MNLSRILIAALLAVAIALPAQANIFMNIVSIPGDSTAYPDWIDVDAFSQGVSNVDNMPVFFPLSITKRTDKATAGLIQAALLGTDLGTVRLEVEETVRDSAGRPPSVPTGYFVIELHQAKVVSVSTSTAAGDTDIFESVSLTCATFTITYTPPVRTRMPQVTTGSCGN